MSLPGVSLLCLTFNDFPQYGHLLGEVVECFRRQTYQGPMELLIYNSCPRQPLICKVPDVRVFNADSRPPTLGACRNEAVKAAAFDLLMPADHDDLFLEHKVSQAVEGVVGFETWKPWQCWYMPSNVTLPIWDHGRGYRHNCCIFRRSAWQRTGGTIARACPGKGPVTWQGGYPPINGDEDALMDQALRNLGTMAPERPMRPSEFPMIYRFGVTDRHISGNDDHDAAYEAIGKLPVIPGTFEIVPRWTKPWDELCKQALAAV